MLGNIIYVGLCKLKHRRTQSIYAVENQHSSANQALMTSSVVDVIKIDSLREVATSLRCHSSLLISMLVSWLPYELLSYVSCPSLSMWGQCESGTIRYVSSLSWILGWRKSPRRMNGRESKNQFYGASQYSLLANTKLFKANHDSLPCRLNTSQRRAVPHYAPGIGYIWGGDHQLCMDH
jgi:hypothetical protein